ncbi:MAG: hypothetical protein R2867_07210 [Caldilineaceae bacterium]
MLVNFTVLVGGALLLLQQGALPSQVGYQSLSLAVLLLSIPLFLFLAFVQGKAPLSRIFAFLQIYVERHPLTGSWFRHSAEVVADSEQQVIHLCRHHPRAVLGALLITLIGWSVIICEFAYAAHILGACSKPPM